ncbi:MAG: hypothetical protein SF053_17735 [Bacteroidia bacterium]|nr:hypothetical protein [Bacteroidia bacterium]
MNRMKSLHHSPQRWLHHAGRMTLLMCLATVLGLTAPGCNSKKKLAEEKARQEAAAAAAQKAQKIAQMKADLESILRPPVRDMADLEAREALLAQIKSQQPDDSEILGLIARAEAFLKQERERLLALSQQQQQPPVSNTDPRAALKGHLQDQMQAIASAPSIAEANTRISEALALFASPETPVLIIISRTASATDYDRPTTILKYLNYLKDQKRNPNKVEAIKTDATGKITEIELIKK